MTVTDQRGVAAVEMAISMLFLIPLLIGLVDVGRLIYSHIALQEATQEGVLLGVLDDGDGSGISEADIRARVISSTSFPLILDAEIDVDCITEPRSEANGAVLTVTVDHTHDLLLPFTGTAQIRKVATGDRIFDSCPSP